MDARVKKKQVIGLNATLEDAIRSINTSCERIVHVISEDDALQGILTDPDIRRLALANVPLSSPVTAVMKRDPVVGRDWLTESELLDLFTQWDIYQLPILDRNGRLVGLRSINEMINRRRDAFPHSVILMAGGRGTRLYPHTHSLPKPLVPIHGKPILRIILDGLLEKGFQDIHISLFHLGDMIKREIERFPAYDGIQFIEEDEPLGTAGALGLIKGSVHYPILVQNADVLTRLDYPSLIRFHEKHGNDLTIVVRQEIMTIPYGVVVMEGNAVKGIREKPKHPYFANLGIYVLNESALSQIPSHTRFDMTSLIERCLAQKMKVGSFPIYEYWADIGCPADLEKAREDFSMGDPNPSDGPRVYGGD